MNNATPALSHESVRHVHIYTRTNNHGVCVVLKERARGAFTVVRLLRERYGYAYSIDGHSMCPKKKPISLGQLEAVVREARSIVSKCR